MQMVGFIILTVLALGSALLVILRRHPVESALALAINLISIAGFYLLLHTQFIALLQVIVYAGAIMVLILFVVMLLNLGREQRQRSSGFFQRPLALILALLFVWVLVRAVSVFAEGLSFGEQPEGFGTIGALGRDLFSFYFYPFEAISLLLIVAMIGAVLLAKRRL